MPSILLTNDDGFQAPALAALARALAGVGRVTAFAPDHNWSAAGHTKTMHKPLRITQGTLADGTPLYVTTGTPSDCVGLALLGVVAERPDIVVSGINQGSNLGHDVTYSGTVAAAMEAAVNGLPAIAASQEEIPGYHGDLDFAAQKVAWLVSRALSEGLPSNCLLNVNFPALPPEKVLGIQPTRLGRRVYHDVLIRRFDPKGRPYYWIGGDPPGGDPDEGTDIGALARGYISVTPINLNMTDSAELAELRGWGLQ
jgi:5'-nucleotidase